MKPKLILFKDTNPTTSGCYSVVQFNYQEFRPVVKPYADKRNIFNIKDEIKILIKDNEIEVLKITWGGLSKEKLFSRPLAEFTEQLSNHPRFKNSVHPFPTLLETVTYIALENLETGKFLKSLEGHLIGGRSNKDKNTRKQKDGDGDHSLETSLFLHTIDHSNGSAKTLLELLEKENIATSDTSTQEKVAFEFFFLFLYLLESTLQTKLGQIKGRELADKVLEVSLESLSKNSDFEQKTFKEVLLDDYMERIKKYSQMPDFIAEKPAGTLFWEFGKTVASILGKRQDVRIVILVQTLCTDFLININEVKLLK